MAPWDVGLRGFGCPLGVYSASIYRFVQEVAYSTCSVYRGLSLGLRILEGVSLFFLTPFVNDTPRVLESGFRV